MAKKKNKVENNMKKAVDLTQDAAKATLNSAVQTAEMSEELAQGVYKAGYDANANALKVAKGYWDATSEIRQDWVRLTAATGESAIDGATSLEVPYQNKMVDFGKRMFGSVTDTIQAFVPQAKNAK